ncbi:carboxypeptidase regulatory-like domain-containing protein [Granulicella sp. S190]|uniref:carboxypeptidase regulatory-like domain-containing protein n=1 Tax=Granulicella sp. S190 TaxID=1747226 RepID=UPI00131C2BCD|nr:carboxypeptidase regulatory-like domain-containing protein [Granulicella sp. S190]
MRTLQSSLIALVLLVLSVGMAKAQGTSQIVGTVTDPTGAIVPQAKVTLTSPQTGGSQTAFSNGAGIFEFNGLDIGTYNLSVSATGFQTVKKNDIVVNVGASLKENIALAVGSSSQTVTVEANGLQVQSESNEVSTLITGQQIVQLATNGRNVYALTTLGTGVSTNAPSFNGITAQGSNANLSFNGLRPDHNNWLIDGGEVYDRGSGGKLDVLPSPDVLSEFRVLSSNYTPDYGISSGGTIAMELKSGTRSLHGGLWEFIRNDALDANAYFANQNNQPKPELRLNIYGGDVGGPVVIPHLYNNNRQKTFFFWSEEWRKLVQGANPTAVNTIPANDFPTAGAPLTYTPFNGQAAPIVPNVPGNAAYTQRETAAGLTPGQPFPNGIIPATLLDPNAVLFLGTGAIPPPNAANNQTIVSPKQPTDVREDTVRIDHNITDKLHLLGSWIHDTTSQTVYPPMWSSGSYYTVGNIFQNPSWAAVVKLSQTLSPTLLNETAFNVNGNTIQMTPVGVYAEPAGWSAGSFFTGNNALNRLPQIAFSGGPINTTYAVNYWPWHNSFLDYQIRDDLSWVRGRHSLKFGVSYMRSDKNQQLQADTQGDYTFQGGAGQASTDAYVNFLLGFASNYQQLQSQAIDHWVNNTYSAYVQDDWHATSRLTLNLGVRYDGLPHVTEKNNQVATFNPALFTTANAQSPNASTGSLDPTGPGFSQPAGAPAAFYLNGIALAGQNGIPAGLVKNNYFTAQPRLGFAYDVSGNGKTVFRGGLGVFYERVQGNDTYNVNTTPPFAYQPKANQVFFSNPNTSYTSGATAASPVSPANLTALSNYYPNPATTQYSFGVQQELAPSIILGLQYVGSSAWNQNNDREINDLALSNDPTILAEREAVATSGSNGLNANANLYRPYQGFGNIKVEENGSNSSYNSFQAALRMEKKHGLSLQLAYTWSHEIDISSGDLGNAVSNPYDLKYDRGSGAYDRRHIFNANYVYDLPFFLHSDKFVLREFVAGWQIAGVTTAEAGTPEVNGSSVGISYNGPDTLGLGGNTFNRPNVVGAISYPKTQHAWFNTAAFAAPVAPWTNGGTTTGYGNSSKDVVVGPGLFNWNISLYKDIALPREGMHFQFRAESFNTFNHTEFQNVDANTADQNFGQVTSTFDPRTLQFGLKFLF